MANRDEQRNALRGLATRGPLAAFSNTPKTNPPGNLELGVHQLAPMPNQARTFFDPVKLEELAALIREHGVLQPLVGRSTPNVRWIPRRLERSSCECTQGVTLALMMMSFSSPL